MADSQRTPALGRRTFIATLAATPLAIGGCAGNRDDEKRLTMEGSQMVSFVGGRAGGWRILRMEAVRGPALTQVSHLEILEGEKPLIPHEGWHLRGVVSHLRYTTKSERERLAAVQASLGRKDATRAALIPLKKSEGWWSLAQDERRMIFEERSHHIEMSLSYLPAIARRLHHSRELGEPFDFLTWFEYAPVHEALFDELVKKLRQTEEWKYVEREIDIRLDRE